MTEAGADNEEVAPAVTEEKREAAPVEEAVKEATAETLQENGKAE